ncbi:MAG: 2-oxoacid:acceptor oxidoreductase family protein [Spirochaetia bacterium]
MNILITGVGGQGTVTLGDLIAERAMGLGLPVSVFHSRGMAHRGGRVAGEIRIASRAGQRLGPRLSTGGADVLVGMEIGETINSLPFLKEGGVALLIDYRYVPSETALKKDHYPELSNARELFAPRTPNVFTVVRPPAPVNLFALGWLAAILPTELDPGGVFGAEGLEEAIRRHLKKNTEENVQVFRTGYAHGRQG